ncbi:hypothetical protein BGW36DRAFT_360954 [Talaromyces proteolyticus]|uniref:NACHT domain-containing protein n=1 Tax=Talaromyces proteolyticus TaxID=1131652 RepID=A0AAD4PZ31_9EURO|nr:uncharacterized protein BGW36DRAFT_360954 [Talaromyces proteolyticus]KAH8695249.1 hypothetical protein BGW36DRAFT_360954 [Talaromyces proteolyticus]
MSQRRRLSHTDYTIGWICALSLETAAAKAMLDEIHPPLPQPADDHNSYTLGEVVGHHVVIACLPAGVYGTTSTTAAALRMKSTYPALHCGLLVGIGGGVPSSENDIRLGDVVVSKPFGSSSGVIQYDYGKTTANSKFQVHGTLNKPPPILLTAMSNLQADEIMGENRMDSYLAEIVTKYPSMSNFTHQGEQHDILFKADYDDSSLNEAGQCDDTVIIKRPRRNTQSPKVFYGLVASGNQVMKDGRTRDEIAKKHGIICFEMEAAGLMDYFPCLVVRGICDYADSHKNKRWQEYAAATAAAYAKALLSKVNIISTQQPEKNGIGNDTYEMTPEHRECLRKLFLTNPTEDKDNMKRRKGDRAPGTCAWIMCTEEIEQWMGDSQYEEDHHSTVLWLYGNPGTGKTTMSMFLTEEIPKCDDFERGEKSLAYFFCDASSESHRTVTAILRGLLYQMVRQNNRLIEYLQVKFEELQEKLFNSFSALWSCLLRISCDEKNGQRYYIIDALDECEPESQQILLRLFNEIPKTGVKPHFLITSRPYPEIASELCEFDQRDLASYIETLNDTSIFISSKVEQLKRKRGYTSNVEREITKILNDKAEGTFLWAGIALKEIESVRSRDVVKVLQRLPRGLDSTYQQLLDTALENAEDETDQNTIMRILSYVAVSRRPLTLSELAVACELYLEEEEEDRIAFIREDIELCRLIIVIQDDIVRLLHQSVKDFLFGKENQSAINQLKAHASLAYRSINYLLEISKPAVTENVRYRLLFLDYARMFWPEHVRLAETEFIIVEEHAAFFQIWSDERDRCFDDSNYFDNHIPLDFGKRKSYFIGSSFIGSSLFHFAAHWGITLLVIHGFALLLDNKPSSDTSGAMHQYDDSEFVNMYGVTPLEEAAWMGHLDVMKLLLNNAIPNMIIREKVIEKAASHRTNAGAVLELLFDKAGSRILVSEKVMTNAIRNSHCGKEAVTVILQRWTDEIQIKEKVISSALLSLSGPGLDKWSDLQVRKEGFSDTIDPQILSSIDVGVLKLLFNGMGKRIRITTDLLVAAAKNSNLEVLATVVKELPTDVSVVDEVFELAILHKREWKERLSILLNHKSNNIPLTGRLIMAVASSGPHRKNIMRTILNKKRQYTLGPGVMELIAGKFDVQVMKKALDCIGRQFIVTDQALEAVDQNENIEQREGLRTLLLNQRLLIQSIPAEESMEYSHVSSGYLSNIPAYLNLEITQKLVVKGHSDEVWVSCFSPDGSRLSTGGRDCLIIIYNTPNYDVHGTLSGHENHVTSITWSPKDMKLLSGSADGQLRIWDTDDCTCIRVLQRHQEQISRVFWTTSCNEFISSSLDNRRPLILWSDKGEVLHEWNEEYRAQASTITPDGSRIIVADTTRQLHIYAFPKREKEFSIPCDSKASSISVDADSKSILLSFTSGEVKIISLESRKVTCSFRGHEQQDFVLTSQFFGKQEDLIVTGSEDNCIYVWDRATGSILYVLKEHKRGTVNSISVHPKNPNMFVSTGDDCTTRVWLLSPKTRQS